MSGFPMSAARFKTFTLLLSSFAVLAAMTTVQFSLVAGKIEVPVRLCASALGLAAVPVPLLLAFRDWLRNRARLSPWRNGFALGSIVVLFAVWMFYWAMLVALWISPHFSQSFGGLELIGLFLDSIILGFALAFTLRGVARPQAISAALLMWACIQAGIYF